MLTYKDKSVKGLHVVGKKKPRRHSRSESLTNSAYEEEKVSCLEKIYQTVIIFNWQWTQQCLVRYWFKIGSLSE